MSVPAAPVQEPEVEMKTYVVTETWTEYHERRHIVRAHNEDDAVEIMEAWDHDCSESGERLQCDPADDANNLDGTGSSYSAVEATPMQQTIGTLDDEDEPTEEEIRTHAAGVAEDVLGPAKIDELRAEQEEEEA